MMGDKIVGLFAILFVGLIAVSCLFGIGAFLYLILSNPIITIADSISEKKKNKVLESSKLIKGLQELNSNFTYELIEPEYCFRKECKSKAEYDRTQPHVYLHTVLSREKALIRNLEKAIQINNAVIDDYEAKCSELLSRYGADPSIKNRYRRAEFALFEKEKIYIGTTYKFKIIVSFITPQRRKRYNTSKSFSREEILTEMAKVKQDKIARDQRAAEMEYERSRMTAKLRYEVLKRDNYRCVICGASSSDGVTQLHVDHIVPIARGGKTELSNLQTLCQRCNLGKGISD